MVAVFTLTCCQNEIVFGRFRGNEMYPPSMAVCPNGCAPKTLPNGRPERFVLQFMRYQSEELLTPELRATWPLLEHKGEDYWHKHNRLWREARAKGGAKEIGG